MSTLLFVLLWIVVALALVGFALRGGRAARKRADSAERRTTRLAVVGFVLLFLAFVVAIPLAISDDITTREDVPEVNIANLTERQIQGRELFGQRCKICHTLRASNATANVGPNLDELKPPAELTLDAIENGRSRGNGQMAADLAEGEDAEAIADYVEATAGRTAEQ